MQVIVVKGKRDSNVARAAQRMLWGIAAGLLVCAGAWFFEEGLNAALDAPGAWAFGDNAALAVVGVGAIVVANVVWAPGAVVGAGGGGCGVRGGGGVGAVVKGKAGVILGN